MANAPTCPFPSGLHPEVEAIQADSLAWARAMRLVDGGRGERRLAGSHIGYLTGRAFPSGPLPILKLATRWITLFCLLDDLVEVSAGGPLDIARTLADLHHALRTGERVTDHVLADAYLDLHREIVQLASPDWHARFAQQVEAIHSTFVWEALHRTASVRPDVQTYGRMREVTAGLLAAFCFHELLDPALTARLRDDPGIDELRRDASRIVGFANDIYTWQRELEAGELHNLVLLYAFREGMPLSAAVDRAVAVHDGAVERLRTATDALVGSGDPATVRYAGMLRSWVGGHDAWGRATGRYRSDTVQQAS